MNAKPSIYITLGPPGSGKGSQAKNLSQKYSIPHISTGDLLREECKKNTPLSAQIKSFIDRGAFPSEDIIESVLFNRINQSDCKNGFILDGVPRTLFQAKLIDQKLTQSYSLIFINFILNDQKIIERLSGRRVCPKCHATYHITNSPPKKEGICDVCGTKLITRDDDQQAVIKKRLEIFHTQFSSLEKYYQKRDNWIDISADQSIESCFDELLEKLQKLN